MRELVLVVDGDETFTITPIEEDDLKQLIQFLREGGVETIEVKEIPCG